MTALTAPSVVAQGQPFSEAKTKDILDRFYRDGFVLIPGVLTPEEVEAAKAGIDRVIDDPKMKETHNLYGDWVAVRLFETDNFFRDLLVREPIISLAEAVLGANCHIMAQNAVRNAPGNAIDTFHVDDADPLPEFPCPEGMERHDPRYRMPVFRMTVQIPLTDIPTMEYGPSEFVAGSHYSGKNPSDPKNPTFDGHGATPVFCKAGDIYLHNGQCWHRGAPNTSSRTRYLLQHAFSRRFVAQRFYPFIDYKMPPHVWEGAGERLQRVLGRHTKGAYG